MSMWCQGCNKEAYSINGWIENGVYHEVCNECGNPVNSYVPDVYLARSGQQFANLCDPTGKPYEIQSKRHKKEIMDQLGVSEAGGTVNGARFGTKSWIDGSRDYRKRQFAKDRPMIQKIHREWKERADANKR